MKSSTDSSDNSMYRAVHRIQNTLFVFICYWKQWWQPSEYQDFWWTKVICQFSSFRNHRASLVELSHSKPIDSYCFRRVLLCLGCHCLSVINITPELRLVWKIPLCVLFIVLQYLDICLLPKHLRTQGREQHYKNYWIKINIVTENTLKSY